MASQQNSQDNQAANDSNGDHLSIRTQFYDLLRNVNLFDFSHEMLMAMKYEKLVNHYQQILVLQNKTDTFWEEIKKLTNFYSPFTTDIIKLTTRLARMIMELEMIFESKFKDNCQSIDENRLHNENTEVKQIEIVTKLQNLFLVLNLFYLFHFFFVNI